MCLSKAREWPHSWQMPGPRAVQNLQMPHPQDWQGGQMPHSSPVGGWVQVELTDALCTYLSMVCPGMEGGGWGVQPTGNLTFSGCQMSITPPLGLHFESHFHPWGELIGTHNSLYCVNDIWNKSYMNCGNEMKWRNDRRIERNLRNSQFMQLCKEAWKKSWIFFSGFFTQLHKLRSPRRSFLHFQSLLWHWASSESNYYLVTK